MESALAVLSAALLVVTLISRTWIETVFGVDPDRGSGSLEWIIVGVATAVTVVSVSMASREWRRHRPVPAVR
jgi:hypothetical protein